MKKIILTLCAGAAVMLVSAPVLAQNKIGYIDINELIAIMPSAKKADSLLNDYRDALVRSAHEKQNSLNEAYNKFVNDSATLTPAVKEVRRKELQEMIQQNAGLDQKVNNDLEVKREELLIPVQNEALNAVKDVAKEKGYSFVYYKEAVIIAPPGDDLLEAVKKKLKIQ